MKTLCLTSVLLAALIAGTGCISIDVGTEAEHALISVSGLITGYISVTALPAYDGHFFEFNILGDARGKFELAHLDIWPIAGAGVGLAGARARLLMLEFGLGTLFYHPKTPFYYRNRPAPMPPPEVEVAYPPTALRISPPATAEHEDEQEHENGCGESKIPNPRSQMRYG